MKIKPVKMSVMGKFQGYTYPFNTKYEIAWHFTKIYGEYLLSAILWVGIIWVACILTLGM